LLEIDTSTSDLVFFGVEGVYSEWRLKGYTDGGGQHYESSGTIKCRVTAGSIQRKGEGRVLALGYRAGYEQDVAGVSVMWTAGPSSSSTSSVISLAAGVYRVSLDDGATWGSWRPLSLSVPDLNRPIYNASGNKLGFERLDIRELTVGPSTAHRPDLNSAPTLALDADMMTLHDFWVESQLPLLMSTYSLLLQMRKGVVRVFVVISEQLGNAGVDIYDAPRDVLLTDDAINTLLMFMEIGLNLWISKLTGYHGFDQDKVRVELYGVAVDSSHETFCLANGRFKGEIAPRYMDTRGFVATLDPRTAQCGRSWDNAVCTDTWCQVLSRAELPSGSVEPVEPDCGFGPGRYDICLYIRDLPLLNSDSALSATGSPTVIHYDSYHLALCVADAIKSAASTASATAVDEAKYLSYINSLVTVHELGHALMLDDAYKYPFLQGRASYGKTIMWSLMQGVTDLDHQYVRTLWDLQGPTLDALP
jgi:hypothetical protein